MRRFVLSVFAVVCVALTATAQSQAPARDHVRVGSEEIGVVHKEIAESSPVASATLQAIKNPVKAGEGIRVHFTLENRSGHDIEYTSGIHPVIDVRDENGNLAPETETGQALHFFSPHHTDEKWTSKLPLHGIIPAHGKEEGYCSPSAEYRLSSGTYTVVGYVCTIKEGPECFKTNTITITVE